MPKRSGNEANAASPGGGFFCGRRPYLLALLTYAMISFVVFYPTIMHPLANVPGGASADLYESVWNVWRVGYSAFTLHQGIWHSSLIFWPSGASLIFQVAVPISALIAYPFALVSLPLAYNVIFFCGMVFSGLAMMLLSDYLLQNKYAAFVAGVVFAFSAFHIAAAYPDIDFSNIGWIPVCIYLFLRILDKRNWRIRYGKYLMALALSASLVLMFYTANPEQVIMALMVFAIIIVAYLAAKKTRQMVINREFVSLMALCLVLFLVLDSWALVPILSGFSSGGGSAALNQQNSVAENMRFSDNLLYYINPSFYNGLTNYLGRWNPSYGTYLALDMAYVGFSVLALALLGLYRYGRRVYLWAAIGIIFFLLSLGPYIQVGKANTGIPGPYLLLKYLPAIGLVREPGRFALIVSLAFAVMASYGMRFILEKAGSVSKSRLAGLGILAAVAIIILAETAAPPLSAPFAAQVSTNISASSFYSSLGQQKGAFAVLVLPIVPDYASVDPVFYPSKAMLTTVYSHKPIIGGYLSRETLREEESGYNIPLALGATELEEGHGSAYFYQNYTNATVYAMHQDNISFVTVDKAAFSPDALAALDSYMGTVFGNPVYEDNSTIAFSTASAVARRYNGSHP